MIGLAARCEAMAATSEPASFSDRAKAASHCRPRTFGSTAWRMAGEPARPMAPGAQALHREGEIGEAVVPSQRFA